MNQHLSRRDFLRAGAAGACAAALPLPAWAGNGKRPNIVFLFSDDHACQAISAYGWRAGLNQTPNIDRIAAEGAIFRNNFCANSICAPSRATVLTGKHSHMNGQLTNKDTFDGTQQTFPQLLQKAGYRTAIIGKWHLKSDPTGFDEWKIYPGQGTYYNPDYVTSEGDTQVEGYSVETTTDLALDFLKRKRSPDQPFMLMCQYKAPHRAWMPGPDYLDKYKDTDLPEPPNLLDDFENRAAPASQQKMTVGRHMKLGRDLKLPVTSTREWKRMTPAQQQRFAEAYEAENAAFKEAHLEGDALTRWKYQRYMKDYLRCVAAVDDSVGRILGCLRATGLESNTIVVYSSDQGFYLGEHGWFDKRWMYEESLRMPLVVRWPGVIKPGTEIEALTQNIDFAPTLLDAASVAAPAATQGKSLVPLMKGAVPENWRTSIYYHYYEFPGAHSVAKHYGVRTDRYKLIHYYEDDAWELFDLKTDPLEMKSLYGQPEFQELVTTMTSELTRLRKLYGVPADNMAAQAPRRRKKR